MGVEDFHCGSQEEARRYRSKETKKISSPWTVASDFFFISQNYLISKKTLNIYIVSIFPKRYRYHRPFEIQNKSSCLVNSYQFSDITEKTIYLGVMAHEFA